jgi:hypothetical protein
MKKAILLFLFIFTLATNQAQVKPTPTNQSTTTFLGEFTDDYGIRYSISDTLWLQHPRTRFHIIRWDVVNQFILAKNDNGNPGDGGLYTRIDYMRFSDMEPWKWGYCLTVYNAKTDALALAAASADREHPRKGCNGFPFSRMKVVQ